VNINRTLAALSLAVATSAPQAAIIDFVDMTEKGAYGESAWSTLSLGHTGFSVDISGTKNGAPAFAYLDWSHAGLGVCGSAGSSNNSANTLRSGKSSNICNPGNDDNVTVAESLSFVFSSNVVIEKIWFNNTHDPDLTIISPDLINIDGASIPAKGNGYAPTSDIYNTAGNYNSSGNNWLGSFAVSAGHQFNIGFNNEQFYISGMEVRAVPEPSLLALFAAGLIGMGATRFRRRCG
jgi:hypothetical protein